MEIILPFNYSPRSYQLPLLRAMDTGTMRAFCLWHRRSGKDITLWNLIIKKSFEKKGLYYYFFPTYTQAKKIIWDGITIEGVKFLDYIPRQVARNFNISELKIDLINGSAIQLIGTDNYDSIRGTNPVGCIFSEYAYQNPMAWEVVKPILKVNGGWAVFNTTPNGKNHAYLTWQLAESSDNWFSEKLTIRDTNILTDEDIKQEIAEGMTPEMAEQEYYCSFAVGMLGAYYIDQLKESQDRICNLPIEKLIPIDVWFDLGKTDSTAIIFRQDLAKEIRIIDHEENHNKEVDFYCKLIKEKGYTIRYVYLPHDAFAKRMESKFTIAEQFTEAGFTVKRVPGMAIENGIQQVRRIFPRLWFDKERCKKLLWALENYHREYDDVAKVFRNIPKHDWSSHSSDCLRYMAVSETDFTDPNDYEISVQKFIDHQPGRPKSMIPGAQTLQEWREYQRQAVSFMDD